MSVFGRMNYFTHLLFYPLIAGGYVFGYKPYAAKKAEKQFQDDMDDMVKAKTMDPDLFNPFTPIPWHNNPELKYAFAHINMRHYMNKDHINEKDYIWKGYHDSYDHANKKVWLYNWTSV